MKQMQPLLRLLVLVSILCTPAHFAQVGEEVDTRNPRTTMMSFLSAMNDYRQGVEKGDEELIARLDDAIQALNLSEFPLVIRHETGREAATLIKEIIDRKIVVRPELIPDGPVDGPGKVRRWRLKSTKIVIGLSESGDHEGEYLFTPQTIVRAKDWYDAIKEMPYLKGSGQGASYKEPFLDRVLPPWAKNKTLGFMNAQWLGLLLVIILSSIFRPFTLLILGLFRTLAKKAHLTFAHRIIELIDRPLSLIVLSGVWYFFVRFLRFEGPVLAFFSGLTQALFSAGVVWTAYRLTGLLEDFLRYSRKGFPIDEQLIPVITKTLRGLVLIFGTLVSVQNLGFNVMSLLAGVGIGGLALALAAKDTAANFFGSMMIFADRPFRVGDWIKVGGEQEGTVEEIGLRSTRLRTFYNSQISVPNAVIAATEVDNMGRRRFRRVFEVLGLTYDTGPDEMEAFLEGIKQIIQANAFTKKDGFHVVFKGFGESALEIMIYFFLEVPSWSQELVEKQNIMIEIMRLADRLGVEFAFPTQTLHVESLPSQEGRKRSRLPDTQLKEAAIEFGPNGKSSKPSGLGIFVPPYQEK